MILFEYHLQRIVPLDLSMKLNQRSQLILTARRSQIKICAVKIHEHLQLFQKLSAHLVQILHGIDLINHPVQKHPVICFQFSHNITRLHKRILSAGLPSQIKK